MEILLPLSFGLLGLMILAWFIMITKLFGMLRGRHPATYERIGKPSLFLNNSIQNNGLFFQFLLKSEFESLDDPPLIKLCLFMRVFFVIYLILFFGLIGAVVIVGFKYPHSQ